MQHAAYLLADLNQRGIETGCLDGRTGFAEVSRSELLFLFPFYIQRDGHRHIYIDPVGIAPLRERLQLRQGANQDSAAFDNLFSSDRGIPETVKSKPGRIVDKPDFGAPGKNFIGVSAGLDLDQQIIAIPIYYGGASIAVFTGTALYFYF